MVLGTLLFNEILVLNFWGFNDNLSSKKKKDQNEVFQELKESLIDDSHELQKTNGGRCATCGKNPCKGDCEGNTMKA